MKANIRYNLATGKILECAFGEINQAEAGEEIIQLDDIPNNKTQTIVGGEVVDVAPLPTQTEVVQGEAKSIVQGIPGWSTFSGDEAVTWIDENVVDINDCKVVLKKMAKLLCALRDQQFPDIRGNA